MKILVIDEEFPFPLNSGKRSRSFNLIKRLSTVHQLRYLAYGKEESESWQGLFDAGMNPIAVLPQVPDVILCEWSPYGIYVENITHIGSVIVAHNIESRIWHRYFENEPNPIKKWYIRKQAVKVAAFERAAFNWVDGATAVSSEEAEAVTELNRQLPVEVIDNGVDLDFFVPGETAIDKDQLVFTGAMDWRPNQDAAVYFVTEMFPLLQEICPSIKVCFVGRNPPQHVRALNEVEGIEITGTVDDVRPFIDRAAVYIVPLRIGGGSRLKILEAMAMKKAIVSTTVGAEGLDVTDGRDILLADSPEKFVKQIAKLIADRDLNLRLGEAGRRLVEAKYGWDGLADKLSNFLQRVVRDR
jgi:glycosyltransferase involved in cell wall biosynthesis